MLDRKFTNPTPTEFRFRIDSEEKIPTTIWETPTQATKHVANKIAEAIRKKQSQGERIVLGLATGSTPIRVYEELINLHKNEGLSFFNVFTFNLDEYFPMNPKSPQSYVSFMYEKLFDHIDIPKENIHIPDGTIPLNKVQSYCQQYEDKIAYLGGIDIQLLGIGRTGHIGFNEPGSKENSKTRLVLLDRLTRQDAKKDFVELSKVPHKAITMGIDTIMNAREIYLLAWGTHKASIIKEAVEGSISSSIPATYLQNHPNAVCHIDQAASEFLTRINSPWLVGGVVWDEKLVTKAVAWLSLKIDKPILKLTEEDYTDNGLSDLILEYDSAYNINIKVFNKLQHTITGWPGGKPNEDDTYRPERKEPAKKRVIIFSPHPDDDVISMGGTFLRLVDQGHDVHVAYQTSGNNAVHSYDALRYVEFFEELIRIQDLECTDGVNYVNKVKDFIQSRTSLDKDIAELRRVNALIRRGEARSAARYVGLDDEHIHFMDLPFYETNESRKKPLSKIDIDQTRELIQKIKPHQIFAAGDLSDPNGTHRVCLNAVVSALEELKDENWFKDCWLWLYRGAWHEWPVSEIEMAVPISPKEFEKKRRAILLHQSQKDSPPVPGDDSREFWERAKERNESTARIYRNLGLAEYEAMEAFARWTIK